MSYYKNKHDSFEKILRELISLLPSSYNKEVDDTNYYKLLRALAQELSDAEIEIKQMKDNIYLNSVSPEAIYNNFGVLVKLKKDPRWDDEKYRHLISGVTQSLLKGPTKQSLIDGFKLFTNFKVNIYELYKELDKLDPSIWLGYNPMFTFAIEVEKPVDEYVDQEALVRDANYIINIIKPAHTLCINIITIVAEEDYRKYYRIERQLGKEIEDLFNNKILQRINEKIIQRFFDEARDYAEENGVSFDEAVNILRRQSSNMSQSEYDQLIREMSERLLNAYRTSFTDCNPIRERTIDDFIELAREQLRGSLELKYYKELKDEVFRNANVELTQQQVYNNIMDKQEQLIREWEQAGHNRFDKTEEEWFYEARNALKEEYLRNYIIEELGGKEKLWEECKTIIEPFRLILEKNFENTVPYCGMDKMESEASWGYTEGIFGWRHINYDLQLKTSLDPNVSRIGGARLIGPRYVLNDLTTSDAYLKHEDEMIPKFINDGELQDFGEDKHFHLYQTNFDEMTIPCEHNTHNHLEIAENPFDTPDEERHINFHQNLHEYANFAQNGSKMILNVSNLNDSSLYFCYQPDYVEEIRVDWAAEIFDTPDEERNVDILFGLKTEEWELPEESRLVEVDWNLSEDNFYNPLEERTTNIEWFLNETFGTVTESKLIEFEKTFFETVDSFTDEINSNIEWSLSDNFDNPLDEISSHNELFQDEHYDTTSIEDSKTIIFEKMFTEIAGFAKGYFELNYSELNGDDLLSYNPDEVSHVEVDELLEFFPQVDDHGSVHCEMYKMSDGEKIYIKVGVI